MWLDCRADATGATCTSWTPAQWSNWTAASYANLSTATCNTPVDVCSQVSAALEAAAPDVAGRVAIRTITGRWVKDNVHLKDIATTLPTVATLSSNGLTLTAAAAAWYPATDAMSADNTSYVPPSTVDALVASAAALGFNKTGYLPPPEDAAYYGLRGRA